MTPPFADVRPTGIAGLDLILRGGFPTDRIYLIQGDPGVGKTTLGLQFLMEGVRQKETCLYVTLEETEAELQGVAKAHGWDLSGITLHQMSASEQSIQPGKQNTLFHPAEVELNETIARVMAVVTELRPGRIVFDSLSEMRLLAGDPLRYRRQILALKQQFAGRATTVLFLDDASSANKDVQLQSIAHGVIALTRQSPEYGAARRKLEVVKMRGVDFQSGAHDFIIERGGVRVFPRLVAANHRAKVDHAQVESGVAQLDALVAGGLERGTSVVLLGPAGVGKSSVASQYAKAAIRRKERVACFSFDENLSTFQARARGMGFTEADLESDLLSMRQVDPAELSPGAFAEAVRDEVEGKGVRIVVIDSLNGYLMAMPDERFLLIHMHELLTYLAQRGVLTLLVVAQHGLVGTMQAPVDVTYLADAVMLFRFFEANGQVRKAVSVLKKRVGGHEDTIREFRVTSNGVHVGEALREFRGILTGVPEYGGRSGSLMKGQT